ncbi:MAG: DUF302 domain-containing protein [Hyphomicrobium sp.]|nr:DUF302 domain-containing protein [Hyphomicrobium sp.]
MEANGLVRLQSVFTVKETIDRLEAELHAKGIPVFARIDHAKGAAEAGLHLRPTELIIFGSAKTGTPMMQAIPTTGIDLPLKALAFADADGSTILAYNDPRWVAQRHSVGTNEIPTIHAMISFLDAITAKATK